MQKVDKDGLGLGCRDLFTVRSLQKDNLNNLHMTGCPAWYDLDYIDKSSFRHDSQIKSIYISDPANLSNTIYIAPIITLLKEKFPGANIRFIFHRGIQKSVVSIIDKFSDVSYVDISGSSEGFRIYDKCDLHVGFRVHAHIYNLSIRNKTILIEEDGRGTGVDESLGLVSIKAFSDLTFPRLINLKDIYKIFRHRPIILQNEHLIDELSLYIDCLCQTDFQYIRNAFILQRQYFTNMISFIKKIKS